jgi:hypothetical protein
VGGKTPHLLKLVRNTRVVGRWYAATEKEKAPRVNAGREIGEPVCNPLVISQKKEAFMHA